VTLRRYDVLHSSPRTVTLEMTVPVHFRASLREDAYEADTDTKNARIESAYFGYSASGDVTAELVYAHSGNPEDYELLRRSESTSRHVLCDDANTALSVMCSGEEADGAAFDVRSP
jgi:hypothetical protein